MRVAVFLDLEALQVEARRQGGELSFRKLRKSLSGERAVVHAVCYLPSTAPESTRAAVAACGFTTSVAEAGEQLGMRLAADALAMAGRADTVVIAPGAQLVADLAQALDGKGLKVEVASFDAGAAQGLALRRLGRECIFVP